MGELASIMRKGRHFLITSANSSAMYYQNLIIIHECSKKLLKMKNSKSFFKHLVQIVNGTSCDGMRFCIR